MDKMVVDKSLVLRRATQVTFEVVVGEAILIDMNTGTYFSLNEVGTMFWEELDGKRSLGALAALIADTYNEKSERFVRKLKKVVVDGEVLDVDRTAEDYGMESEEVDAYLARVKAGDPETTSAELTAEFHVPVDMVTADLLELAEKMLADQLLLRA